MAAFSLRPILDTVSLWIHTMNRCPRSLTTRLSASLTALSLVCGLAAPLAQAQTPEPVRDFPAAALRGTLLIQQPPLALLDGVQDKLSPGVRIHTQHNLLALSGSLVDRPLIVNYVRDSYGLISEVWILTRPEIALQRDSASAGTNIVIGNGNGRAVGISIK